MFAIHKVRFDRTASMDTARWFTNPTWLLYAYFRDDAMLYATQPDK
jgi:hypothetical protein